MDLKLYRFLEPKKKLGMGIKYCLEFQGGEQMSNLKIVSVETLKQKKAQDFIDLADKNCFLDLMTKFYKEVIHPLVTA